MNDLRVIAVGINLDYLVIIDTKLDASFPNAPFCLRKFEKEANLNL